MNIQIGITDLCNYRCVMCMQQAHKGLYGKKDICTPELHKGKKGFIDLNLFRKILEETSDIDFGLLKMQWLGESFIHPQITGILKILSDYNNFDRIVFTTNISIMNKEIIKELKKLRSEVQFVFSIDSFNKNTYKNIKGIDNINNVKQNIKMLINEIPEFIYTFQSIIMNENKEEFSFFIETCKEEFGVVKILWDEEKIYSEKENNVFFKRLGAFEQEKFEKMHRDIYKEVKKENDLNERIITSKSVFDYKDKKREPCPAVFRTPTFNWDGTMVYCCMDSFLEQSPGNIRENSFQQLWKGDYSFNIRKAHINRKFEKYSRCARCGNLDVEGLKKDEIEGLL